MPELKNAKHERFAQAIAAGNSATHAYVIAGYKEHGPNAGRLSKNEHIRSRIEQILSAAAKRAEITRADVLKMLRDDREMARTLDNPQMGAAIKAAELIGKDLGMFQETKAGNTVSDLLQLFQAMSSQFNQEHLNGAIGSRQAVIVENVPSDAARLRGPDPRR